MPRIAIAPIQRSVTSWNWRQSRPPGWISVPDFWSGMLTRPPIDAALQRVEQLLLLHRACGRIDRRRLLRAPPEARRRAANATANAPMMKRACARSLAMPNLPQP